MNNKDNFRTSRQEGDNLGERDSKEKLSKNPAPPGTPKDRESRNTPPENEVYVNLEPDELHLSDEEKPEDTTPQKKKK
ncbi:hypothetical protein [Pontibacter mangrovi]|uniref:Uncharacterized protein n=1 Tax=Pontibacter mangrovi TaxID=2589816 RepID=A0A501VXS1_9BACT|nr:hypothetical protein [Pontibacter mangrovi]TPE40614.1 hypothetical protein FJM65_19945 [Pontibacter mangrovi]